MKRAAEISFSSTICRLTSKKSTLCCYLTIGENEKERERERAEEEEKVRKAKKKVVKSSLTQIISLQAHQEKM